MLTQYRLTLTPDRPCVPRPEWGYRLYTALLSSAPFPFGELAHKNNITPVSQYLDCCGKTAIWVVNLLGKDCEETLTPILEEKEEYCVGNGYHPNQAIFSVEKKERQIISSVDELLNVAEKAQVHQLDFITATAFKSQGRYINLPTEHLIFQNLIRKWNGSIVDCPIDIDDDGISALADMVERESFRFESRKYNLKGSEIKGFLGILTLKNHASGFHRQIINMLLMFSEYSGVGIKTALGMGGVRHSIKY